jgi:metallo-beta-lactamase family protein
MKDVEKTLRYIQSVNTLEEVFVGEKHSNLTAEFIPNGHVMGSASILLQDHDSDKTILFTGDMGKPYQSLCGGYLEYYLNYPKDPIKTLVVESTSFDKIPVNFEEKLKGFLKVIHETWDGGGNPVFPTLSFHRAQELMEMIHNCQKSGDIPNDCKIILDAPLAMKILDTFSQLKIDELSKRYGDDPNYYKNDKSSMNRFDLKNKIIIETHIQSKNIDKLYAESSDKVIILASGGMGGYGRSVNYIHGDFAKNPKNSIVLSCYQVAGTEGAELILREASKKKKTGARVIQLNGFTSHISGPEETFGFLERFNLMKLEKVIITHGKNPIRELMAKEFIKRGYPKPILSKMNEIVTI